MRSLYQKAPLSINAKLSMTSIEALWVYKGTLTAHRMHGEQAKNTMWATVSFCSPERVALGCAARERFHGMGYCEFGRGCPKEANFSIVNALFGMRNKHKIKLCAGVIRPTRLTASWHWPVCSYWELLKWTMQKRALFARLGFEHGFAFRLKV